MASRQFNNENKPKPENQVSTTRPLLDLATEVLVEILAYLPAADMIAVQRTCRTIRDIVSGTAYLQYTLYTKINRVNDLLPLDFPYSERLKLLRCHEQSLRDLQFNLFAECHSISDVPDLDFFTLQDSYLIYHTFPTRGKVLQYGYMDLCSTDRSKEPQWVHLMMSESQPLASEASDIVFAVDHDMVIPIRMCVLIYPSSDRKPDERGTAVSEELRTPPWSSWRSSNSQRVHLIRFQQHTLYYSRYLLNFPTRVCTQKSWVIMF